MGRYWVINMGVPVVIGVCQQAAEGGGTQSSFSIVSFTTVTISYGSGTDTQISVPNAQRIVTTVNSGNSFTVPQGGLRSFYDEETAGITLNHSFQPEIDGSSIVASELPADGDCSVTYVITFDEQRFPVKIYNLEAEVVVTSSPFTITFGRLDRSALTVGDAILPALLLENPSFSVIAPVPDDFAQPALTVEIKILMADNTFISQYQAINMTDLSIAPFVVEG